MELPGSPAAGRLISPTSLPRSAMEVTMENLLVGKGYANE